MSLFDDVGSAVGQASSLINQAGALLNIGAASTNSANDLSLVLIDTNQAISGWTSIKVTRGLESCTSSFDIAYTEFYPGNNSNIRIREGNAVTVKIGSDLVLTGYVDKVIYSIREDDHTIRVTGRGKCCDLVDCSAEWPGGQISGTSAFDVATKLAAPYAIAVNLNVDDNEDENSDGSDISPEVIPQFNLIYGETAASILERICRFAGYLYYEDEMGNLVLSRAGTTFAGSGFTQGKNIQEATGEYCMDHRFSEYDVVTQSLDQWDDLSSIGTKKYVANDPAVLRNRKKIIISEQGTQIQGFAQLRANWEAARNAGRGYRVTITTDSWRDATNILWKINTLAHLNIPALKLNNRNYLIGEVTFIRNEDEGTVAKLMLMPAQAYEVQPLQLYQDQVREGTPIATPPGGNTNPAAPTLPPGQNTATKNLISSSSPDVNSNLSSLFPTKDGQ